MVQIFCRLRQPEDESWQFPEGCLGTIPTLLREWVSKAIIAKSLEAMIMNRPGLHGQFIARKN